MTKHIPINDENFISDSSVIWYPFRAPEQRCQICGSDNVLAHVWKCACGVIGNGEMHVHKEEKAVQ